MQLDRATDFAAERHGGVLITLKRDGRPQASNINYVCDARTVRISVTASRAKTNNLQRDPRASLHVTSDDFWRWVVLEGTASFTPVATPDDPDSLEALRSLYRDIRGEDHPDWDDYDRAMVDDERQVLTITLERAYGQLPD
ncbi:PPOX class F420-dependent oxidoreductase [Salsipaludibacter albus]|uniref:PPOX class F420-dependent oxidoreductase n=1 Tax=Salsipaludibacter albus TaxID=2849650 RepID=UPI001EE441E3|nr:PPOX class F420-dependent oxidoreductase [Salsipaludibacter albus]MBY5161229.1 PPOX class F420-dependent oxidoreductase [Salsipaludibacter albus]